ncbi:MFS transporter [Gordonia sp. KTR9]|uniref:MFS transporter n=1 Tax=Gordonia sp. KTR9 TaxID=337191 RepID=UPI00027DE1AA|nr:MFS transporter [Gordonia sp. KTR9]AFR50184.1 major facilitator superfamily MFS_1 [Gordonia sp. KTR9]
MGAALLEDLIPFYPLYAVLFADPGVPGAGLGPAEISALFVVWSVSSVIVEVPTGVLADRMSRRKLLTAGPLITASGFALWTAAPSFLAFAAGFVLWALGGSLRSGTTQALVYDELAGLGRARDYARLSGLMRAAAALGVIGGTALAAPLFSWGGYEAVGIASVVSCLLCSLMSAMLPETRAGRDGTPADTSESDGPDPGDADPGAGWLAIVRSGRRSLRTQPVARRMLLLGVALTWVAALDEYLPLLIGAFVGEAENADAVGAPGTDPGAIALLMIVVSIGDIGGALAAGRFRSVAAIGPAVGLGAIMLIGASLWGHPVGALGIAVAFGILGWARVVADAALQDRLSSTSRATVTSLAGMGEEVVAILAYAGWALGSVWLGPAGLFAVAALPYVVVSALLIGGAMTVRASRR